MMNFSNASQPPMTPPSDRSPTPSLTVEPLAKSLAKPLSRLAISPALLRTTRYASAYLNVLLGNGSAPAGIWPRR